MLIFKDEGILMLLLSSPHLNEYFTATLNRCSNAYINLTHSISHSQVLHAYYNTYKTSRCEYTLNGYFTTSVQSNAIRVTEVSFT